MQVRRQSGRQPRGGQSSRGPIASVVIPCLNAGNSLATVLLALADQSIASEIEVIVVDNGSSDQSREIARRHGAQVLTCQKLGIAPARNTGLAASAGGLLLSLDADCVPADDRWAERHVLALRESPTGVLGTAGQTVPSFDGDRWSQRTDVTPHPAWGIDGELLYAVGGNACFHAQELQRLGGFPSFGVDDAALGQVARSAGYGFAWVPDARVMHRNPHGWWGYARQMAKVGRYSGGLAGRPESLRQFYLREMRRLASSGKLLMKGEVFEAAAVATKAIAQTAGAQYVWLSSKDGGQ
jgi:glycosyltransferase involved in cell wall biosynthesis